MQTTDRVDLEVHKIGNEVGIIKSDSVQIWVTEEHLAKLVEELLFQGGLEVALTIARKK